MFQDSRMVRQPAFLMSGNDNKILLLNDYPLNEGYSSFSCKNEFKMDPTRFFLIFRDKSFELGEVKMRANCLS